MSFIYKNRISQFTSDYKKYKKAATNLSIARVVFFLLIVAGVYVYWLQPIPTAIVLVVGLLLFGRLVILNHKAKRDAQFHEVLSQINERELQAVTTGYFSSNSGLEYLPANHENGGDLDLVGKHSVSSWIDRTVTSIGAKLFVNKLLFPSIDAQEIIENQKAIQDLTPKIDWRQNFMATALIAPLSQEEEDLLIQWAQDSTETSSAYQKVISIFMPLLSVGVLAFYAFDFISVQLTLLYFMVPLLVVGSRLKNTQKTAQKITKMANLLAILQKLTTFIETEKFESKKLRSLQQYLGIENVNASQKIHQLHQLISKFEQRNNMILGIVLNALFVWDIQFVMRLNSWKNQNAQNVKKWVETVAEFDAYISMANYAYNFSELVYPEITPNEFYVEAKNLAHPLLHKNERIGNDFKISGNGNMVIITGANMAGKSTFLRSLGVNLVLAAVGLPVAATKFVFHPIKVFSSMRTQDSLEAHMSFFHAELSRLAQLTELLKAGEKRFIILDEILKGTNSEDKARGSYAFVEKVITYPILGVIATHDLSLCALETKYPNQICNKHFEIEFENEEILFDYTLRNGVCKNMNASFLLQKMGIVDQY